MLIEIMRKEFCDSCRALEKWYQIQICEFIQVQISYSSKKAVVKYFYNAVVNFNWTKVALT